MSDLPNSNSMADSGSHLGLDSSRALCLVEFYLKSGPQGIDNLFQRLQGIVAIIGILETGDPGLSRSYLFSKCRLCKTTLFP